MHDNFTFYKEQYYYRNIGILTFWYYHFFCILGATTIFSLIVNSKCKIKSQVDLQPTNKCQFDQMLFAFMLTHTVKSTALLKRVFKYITHKIRGSLYFKECNPSLGHIHIPFKKYWKLLRIDYFVNLTFEHSF